MRAIALILPPLMSLASACTATGATPPTSALHRTQQEPTAASVGYEDGFFVRSTDGANELVLEGLFQVVAGVFDGDRDPSTDFALKRMRPELAGRVADVLRFRLEPNFSEDEVELEEAWIGFDVLEGSALAMVGRMKAPFNLEEVRSRRHIDFPVFSILNQLAPAEDHGVLVNGTDTSGRWEYGFAAYNGTGEADTGSTKDLAARVMLHPRRGVTGSAWENLQVGLAATIGSQDELVEGESIDNAARFPVVTFAPGVELDGRRWRAGLEGAWFRGPWFVQGEVIAMSQEMSLSPAEEDVSLGGAYLTISRVLTGEAKTFGGVSPRHPYGARTGSGRGAWVLAARVSRLDLDDAIESAGLSEPGTFTDRIETYSLGLNWIPNEHAILRNSLIFSDYGDPVTIGSGSDDSEVSALFELQLHF